MTNSAQSAGEVLSHLAMVASGALKDATSAQPAFYWNQEIADAENREIFRKDWVCPGLAAEIPNTGDYLTYSVAGQPIYCIRDKTGAVKTYSNVCRHRMMQLLEGRGTTSRVICPYHAWTYDLNGQLIGAGHMEYSNGFERKKSACRKFVLRFGTDGFM